MRGWVKPGAGKRGEGAIRILIKVGFEFGRAAIFDAVPKCQLKGNLVVRRQVRECRRSGRQFGWFRVFLGARTLLLG